jgi:hypothetical protein
MGMNMGMPGMEIGAVMAASAGGGGTFVIIR